MENISDDFSKQLDQALRSENSSCTKSNIIQLRPTTTNIVGINLTGDVIYQFTTGSNQYLDLSKCYQNLRYTLTSFTDFTKIENLVDCAFNRAQLYVNGKIIASSNNYTQDAVFSKRVSKSGAKNLAYGNLRYLASVDSDANEDPTILESIGGLDALFLNNGKSLYIPPNSDIRWVFSADSNMKVKAAVGDGTASGVTLTINDLFMRVCLVNSDEPLPANYLLKLLTIDSFMANINAATHNQQISIRAGLVKLGAAFQSTDLSVNSVYNASHFTWANDGVVGTKKLNTIYWKAGGEVIPAERLDISTYGHRMAHNDFIIENHHDSFDSPETYEQYTNQGLIFCYRVVKKTSDITANIELNATFEATPIASAFLFAVNEQVVSFIYENGIKATTTTAI